MPLSAGLRSSLLNRHRPNRLTYAQTVLADAPTLWYRLDEASGATMADSSGNGRGGSYQTANVTYGASGATADGDTAIASKLVAGATGYLASYSGAGLPTGNGTFSFDHWFKTGAGTLAANNKATLAWGGTATGAGFQWVSLNTSTMFAFSFMSDNKTFTAPYALDDGAWHYLGGSWDGTTAIVYLDGNVGVSLTGFTTPNVASGALALGNYGTAGAYTQAWVGSLDEVAIYTGTVLSAARFLAHYRAGKGL